MTIRDLMEQFEIQGAYYIKAWNNDYDTYTTLAEGKDFESEKYKINSKYLDTKITYMYALDKVLNIEVELV